MQETASLSTDTTRGAHHAESEKEGNQLRLMGHAYKANVSHEAVLWRIIWKARIGLESNLEVGMARAEQFGRHPAARGA